MTWPNDIQSATPARYLFKLVTDTESVICNPEPLEWASGTLQIKRDLEVGGVFSSFQLDSLTFVGNGAELLRNLFNHAELNAKCTLVIYWWKSSLRQYVEFPSRFDINFNFYEIVKVGKFAFGVRVKAINNSTQTKLDNRKDVDVDISKLVSIGGFQIEDWANFSTAKLINYAETNVNYRAEFFKDYGYPNGVLLDRIRNVHTFTQMPINLTVGGEFTELQSVPYATKIYNPASIVPFFKEARFTYDAIDVYFYVHYTVHQKHTGTHNWWIEIVEIDPIGTIINTTNLLDFGGVTGTYDQDGTVNISVQKGNSLAFVCENYGIDNTTAYTVKQILKLTQQISASPAAQLEGFPIYNAIERVCQHVLDAQFPIYSEYFGRTDIVYNANGGSYSSEDALRFAHIHGGMNLRGAKIGDIDSPLVLNFKNMFESLRALWNVGYSLEKIGGELRIRIEEYAHFFQDIEVLDFSSRLSKYDIQSIVMPELVPVDIKSGFDSFEYLSANGRSEANTTNQRTSEINTATKLEIISKLRGDTKGILDNISNPVGTTGTTDTKGDNSVFVVKSLRDGANWKPETNENISIIGDTSLFKDNLMNRYFTPTRMLLRYGNRISPGMTKLASESVLRFQSSDKNCSLITSQGGTDLAENADVLVSALDTPVFRPIKHTVEVKFTLTDLEAIQANPLGYITLSDTISGYLLSLKKKNNEDQAEISIIQKS